MHLEGIAHSSIDKCCLLQFLLARANSQGVILQVLRRALQEHDPLPSVGRMFDILHSALARDVARRRAWAQPAAEHVRWRRGPWFGVAPGVARRASRDPDRGREVGGSPRCPQHSWLCVTRGTPPPPRACSLRGYMHT